MAAVDPSLVSSQVYARAMVVHTVHKFLARRLKHTLKIWRKETDDYLNEVKFKLRTSRLKLQKARVVKLMAIKVANEKAVMREAFHAFAQWRLET